MSQDTSSPAYKWARAQEKKQRDALIQLFNAIKGNKEAVEAYNRCIECGALK